LNVAAVLTNVNRDTVRTGLLTDDGGGDNARLNSFSGFADGGNVDQY
jgi:hypothetical protein